jgi:hypothetical protein
VTDTACTHITHSHSPVSCARACLSPLGFGFDVESGDADPEGHRDGDEFDAEEEEDEAEKPKPNPEEEEEEEDNHSSSSSQSPRTSDDIHPMKVDRATSEMNDHLQEMEDKDQMEEAKGERTSHRTHNRLVMSSPFDRLAISASSSAM